MALTERPGGVASLGCTPVTLVPEIDSPDCRVPSEHARACDVPCWLDDLRSGIVEEICSRQKKQFQHLEDALNDFCLRSQSTNLGKAVAESNPMSLAASEASEATYGLSEYLREESKNEGLEQDWHQHMRDYIVRNAAPDETFKDAGMRAVEFIDHHRRAHSHVWDTPDTKLSRFVNSHLFNWVIVGLVLLNVAWIGYETSMQISGANNSRFGSGSEGSEALTESQIVDQESLVQLVGRVFMSLFVLELILKICALRCSFFFGPGWEMNLLDFLLVACSVLNFISEYDVRHLRMLRAARMARVLRVIRVVGFFSQLRQIVCSFYNSLGSLLWSFVMIAAVNYSFAIVFLQGVAIYLKDADSDDPRAHRLADSFGDIKDAMLSLFFAITGGADWKDMAYDLGYTNGFLLYLFVFYVFVMVFGLLNVLVGVFCEQANQASALDQDLIVQAKKAQLRNFLVAMRNLFKDIDKDENGFVTWDEFRDHIRSDHVMTYLLAKGLNLFDASFLFNLLGEEAEGKTDLPTFVYIMMRLTGNAKSTDLIMLLHESRQQNKILKSMAHKLLHHPWKNRKQHSDDEDDQMCAGVVEAMHVATGDVFPLQSLHNMTPMAA